MAAMTDDEPFETATPPQDARYVRPLAPESEGRAPGRSRLDGRRILVVGGGQRVVLRDAAAPQDERDDNPIGNGRPDGRPDADTDLIGNGRAMSVLFAREGAHVAVAD